MPARSLLVALLGTAAAAVLPLQSGFAATAGAVRTAHSHRASRAPGADDRQFMRTAAQSGRFEVAAGQIAQSQGQTAGVRQYGQRLVHDHTAADRKLQHIAANFAITLPGTPAPEQQHILERLRGVHGASFDSEFMEQVGVESHDRAIALFQQEANAPSADPALQHYARATLPTLEQHRRIAQQVQARLSRTPDDQRAAVNNGAHQPSGALGEIQEAVQVVHRMKSDRSVADLLQRARGVFILPDYGRAAVGVGVQGGQGVLETRTGSGFGNPVFYNMGGVSLGAQVGAAGGQLAFLLMTDKAVQQFRSGQKFSLNADAGLTIGDLSTRGQASGGKVEDVVVWSGTKGAYVGASVALTDVVVDQQANRAYYGRTDATPQAILSGKLDNPHNNVLGKVLAV